MEYRVKNIEFMEYGVPCPEVRTDCPVFRMEGQMGFCLFGPPGNLANGGKSGAALSPAPAKKAIEQFQSLFGRVLPASCGLSPECRRIALGRMQGASCAEPLPVSRFPLPVFCFPFPGRESRQSSTSRTKQASLTSPAFQSETRKALLLNWLKS